MAGGSPGTGFFHTGDMVVIERFTRTGDTLRYEVTVEDPAVLMQPWVRSPQILIRSKDPHATIPEAPYCSERDAGHITINVR
jgi:hypothetical protein